MNLKFWVFLTLGFIILGVLISFTFAPILNLNDFLSSASEDAASTELLNYCQSKFNIYSHSQTELNRKSFCCSGIDVNNNGELEEEEYCTNACPGCDLNGEGVELICSEPINYYTNKELC